MNTEPNEQAQKDLTAALLAVTVRASGNVANYGIRGWGHKGSTLSKADWSERKRKRAAAKQARRRNRG